ncbi:spermidine synthase [Sphingopyxis yananensis]|uniref:spermidine synthase n=1 Tax=Sphingopyxis yananensis TaxID=2886687 RepID=UPI001D11914B|nr:fused MFS/spermidine synthase [Sphingopyxis yananensis]MCC2602899.1 fused MFS/spermidine synthase [Sphingopyxis yananensis]
MMGTARRWIFVATILVGSFLLFLVQPMVARMVLPKLGGAPAVWNSAMLVYQALLLGGYAYAHWLGRFSLKRQALVHGGLLLVAAAWLPIGIASIGAPASGQEALWVPLLLLASIGPVFFAVSAQAPLMQRWFAADSAAGDPYYLYAASNLGSFAGLISYPLLVEPNFLLAQQAWGWTFGYGLLFLLVAGAAAARWHSQNGPASLGTNDAAQPAPSLRRKLHWLAIAAVPSGLMLSTTTHLTTDIVAMPLLWVLPLGLYLLSYVFAFTENSVIKSVLTTVAPAALLLIGGLSMINSGGSMTVALASLALLFILSVSLHGYLYHLRPAPQHLTLFYLIMSAGGVLGGLFAALVAPILFDWVYEHPILMVAAALLLPLPVLIPWQQMLGVSARNAGRVVTVLLGCVAAMAFHVAGEWNGVFEGDIGLFVGLMFLIGVLCIGWRWVYVLVLLALMLAMGGVSNIGQSLSGDRVRSYFGVYSVTDDVAADQRRLAHGTTLHGLQRMGAAERLEPTTYYGRTSGVGLVLQQASPTASIAIVGLGAGTLACYRQPSQTWTFFEIDPVMMQIARDPARFTFLSDCAPDAPVVLGDARLMLEQVPAKTFDILVIDAFSSDAIPLHLLTKEAIDIYARALKDDGLLLLHISNRFFDLEPVLAADAAARGWPVAMRVDEPDDDAGYLTGSSWVAMAPSANRLAMLTYDDPTGTPWQGLEKTPAFRRWTDDYASTLPILMWQNILGTKP